MPQKFKKGRVVWFKTDSDGPRKMTVTDAAHDAVSNTWSYELKDDEDEAYPQWVAEKRLQAGQRTSGEWSEADCRLSRVLDAEHAE